MSYLAQSALGEPFKSTVLTILFCRPASKPAILMPKWYQMNGNVSDCFLCLFLNRSVMFAAFHVTVTLTGFFSE